MSTSNDHHRRLGRRHRHVASPVQPLPPLAIGSTIVDWACYVGGVRASEPRSYEDAVEQARQRGGVVWIGLYEPDASSLGDIARLFHFHPLAVEDALHAHQRPKLETYDDTTVLVIKTVTYVEHAELTATSDIVRTGEIMIFVGPGFVVTIRHGEHNDLGAVRRALEDAPDRLAMAPGAVLHAIADNVVDHYLAVADEIQDDIEEIESAVFSPRGMTDTGRVYQLKRELLEFKRAITPLQMPLRQLYERDLGLVDEEIKEYFRDVDDHLERAIDMVGGFDELLTSILQANLAQLSVTQNEDMRKISAWVAIAAVPTMIAGIYGMNFDHMPELTWTFGYPLVIAIMIIICVTLFRGFKHNGWL